MSQLTPQPGVEPHGPDGGGSETYKRYDPLKREDPFRALLRRIWAPLAVLGGLALKFKTVALAIFKLKIFATSATMLVSVAAYAWIWGWRFGVGLVVMLLIHELGHVVELRRQGIKASAPIFIPFLGAVVGMKEMPKNAWREAQVALAGPILGSIGAATAWILGEVLNSDVLVAVAFVGFLLNLFNLLPIVPARRRPCRGGVASSALGRRFARARRAGRVLSQPDPVAHPRDRWARALATLEGTAAVPRRAPTTRSPARSGRRSA